MSDEESNFFGEKVLKYGRVVWNNLIEDFELYYGGCWISVESDLAIFDSADPFLCLKVGRITDPKTVERMSTILEVAKAI